MRPIRLLLIEDLVRVRTALRTLLQQEPEFEVVGEAGDGETALALARGGCPDLILMDLALPGIGGLEIIRILREEGCDARIVVLTIHGEMRAQAENAGADLFLEKGVSPEALLEALRTISPGNCSQGSLPG
ncbi:MAG: response regulator transcription factor [Ardenticatenaceae bacterium]|nr:response regulator transcription factor [Ardenticatenaceae bacterium]